VRSEAVRLANSVLTFAEALRMAGVSYAGEGTSRGRRAYCPFGDLAHLDQGREPAMRVYYRHGYCFACSRWYSVVSLLAEVWQLDEDHAAYRALEQGGYQPPDAERAWAWVQRSPEPDRDALARALTTWCEANIPHWAQAQYSPAVASRLSECLGLLPLVKTADDCDRWLSVARTAMKSCLGRAS
jgi:hypothetical protein